MASTISASMCEEKQRLLVAYEAATQKYFRAMNELRARMGVSPKLEYDRLFKATEDGRAQSEAARAALLEHIREHKC